jgi:hypothetical protein
MEEVPVFIRKWLDQSIVYWGNPQRKGSGGFTFDAPVELVGRCEYKVEAVIGEDGQEMMSRARVYLSQRVDVDGYLYLGTLADSAIGDEQTPASTEGAMRILAFEEIPRITRKSGYLFRVYVNITRWR